MIKYFSNGALLSLAVLVTACGTASPAQVNHTPASVAVVTKAVPLQETQTEETRLAEATLVSEPTATRQVIQPSLTPTDNPEPEPTGTPVPTVTPSPTPADEPEIIEVKESSTVSVNVRSGPGTNYPVVGQLAPGEAATVTGYNSDQSWWQINLAGDESTGNGWVYGDIVEFSGEITDLAEAATPLPPVPPSPVPETEAEQVSAEEGESAETEVSEAPAAADEAVSPEGLADQLRCGKDFCVTYQAMVPIWENGGCIGNHSIYVTVLEGPPPGRPVDGIVLGDTFGNVEVASGSKGPGTAEFTLWSNSMSVKVKRHIDGREFTSEESFPFTSHDELIPAEVLAASGYCDGSIEKCRVAQQQNQICRGHYSWRVTFHKFD